MQTEMKTTLMFVLCIIFFSAYSQRPVFNQKAGNLRLALDKTGKIIALSDATDGANYIARDEASYLLECQKYGADSSKAMLQPLSIKIIEKKETGIKMGKRLRYRLPCNPGNIYRFRT
jgi:hypothetical protein